MEQLIFSTSYILGYINMHNIIIIAVNVVVTVCG